MNFTSIDIVIFCTFYLVVMAFSFWKSRGGKNSADYFLGKRSLPWWLIGISIVAANLSTEQFVGMSFSPKAYIGFNNHGLTAGYDQEVFRWGKASLDIPISFPYIGIGAGWSITNNTFGIVATTFDYLQYEDIQDPKTYNFDIGEMSKAHLMLGLGFFF